jgi:hypothetical protein
MKKFLLDFVLVFLFFGFILTANAQKPTLIYEASFTASGAGASGIPTINLNLPAGKNRVLLITIYTERHHNPESTNFAFASDLSNNETVSTLLDFARLNNVPFSNSTRGAQSYFESNTNKNLFSFYHAIFRWNQTEIPVGSATVTFPALNVPESAQDEMIVTVTLWENVNQTIPAVPMTLASNPRANPTSITTNFHTTTFPQVSNIPAGNIASDIVYFNSNILSSSQVINVSNGWTTSTTLQRQVSNEALTATGWPSWSSYLVDNIVEHSGLSATVAYRSYNAGDNPTITLSKANTNLFLYTGTRVVALYPLPKYSVSGNVLNDPNAGPVNNSTGGANVVPAGLFANLIDNIGNVMATSAVANNGSFSFPSVMEGDYTVVLSTTQGVVNQPAPTPALPNGWINTGEFNGTSNGGNTAPIDGRSATFTVNGGNVLNINFGIQQAPTAVNNAVASQVNPGGTTNITIASSNFQGNDLSGGTVTSIRITSFPTNATSITINGIQYTSSTFPVGGVSVPTNASGNPTQTIAIDPIDGAITSVITYNATDNGGATSTNATLSVPFTLPQCQYVTNGTFANQSNWTGWTSSGWSLISGYAERQPNNVNVESLSQTLTGVTHGNLSLKMTLGALRNSTSTARLRVVLNGVQYMDFAIPGTTGAVTTTASNGASISGFSLTPSTNPSTWVYDTDFTITIPYSGPSKAVLTFEGFLIGTNSNTFRIDNVTLTGNCAIDVIGTVFNDLNSNTIIDGAEVGTNANANLFVYLVNSANVIVDSAKVASNGTYTLLASPNQNYTIELSTIQYALGTNVTSTPIVNSLPSGWINTGENGAGNIGSGDALADGVLAVNVVETSISQQNFGILESTPQQAFGCNAGLFYQIAGTPSALYTVNARTGVKTLLASAAQLGNQTLNALGYNMLDNFLYAHVTGTNQIVRMGADGSYTNIFIPGLPAANYQSGDVGPDGIMYLVESGTISTFRRVDLNTLTRLSDFTTSFGSFTDVVVSNDNLTLYGMSSAGSLISFPLSGAAPTSKNITATGGFEHAAFMDAKGSFYAVSDGTSRVYELPGPQLPNSTLLTLISPSTTQVFTNTDAAACRNATALTNTIIGCADYEFFVSTTLQPNAVNDCIIADGKSTLITINSVTLAEQVSGQLIPDYGARTTINNLGYNPKDNYLWAYRIGTNQLVRIGENGVVDYFAIPGISNNCLFPAAPTTNNQNFFAGDFDTNGIFYLTNGSGGSVIVRVDLDPASPTYLTRLSDLPLSLSPSAGTLSNFADYAISPIDGQIYFVSSNKNLIRINTSTGVVTNVGAVSGITGTLSTNGFQIALMDNDGTLYMRETSSPYRAYSLKNPHLGNLVAVPSVLSSATWSGGGDGASCPLARLSLTIEGSVFNDVNSNTVINSGESFTALPAPVFVYLVDQEGLIADSAHVAPDGSYQLTALSNQAYDLFLSLVEYPVGTNTNTTPISTDLPAGWVHTGENGSGDNTGSGDAQADGILEVNVGTIPVTNQNFGIQQPPVAGNGANDAANPGGNIQVTVPANTFTNIDPSSDPSPGEVEFIRITEFPTGATSIVIDNITYNANVPAEVAALTALIIPTDADGNPTIAITVDPAVDGATVITIPFVSIDNGGFESLNIGNAVLNLEGVPDLTPSIVVPSNTFAENEVKNVVLSVVELLNNATVPGTATFVLEVPNGYVMEAYENTLTSVVPSGGSSRAVNNTQISETNRVGNTITFKVNAGVSIDAQSFKEIGVRIRRTTATPSSVSRLSFGIVFDATQTDYDSNIFNNSFTRILTAQNPL